VVRLQPIRTHDILQRQGTLGKGKLISPVGGTIYANVIWPGMKWKYVARPTSLKPSRPGLEPGLAGGCEKPTNYPK